MWYGAKMIEENIIWWSGYGGGQAGGSYATCSEVVVEWCGAARRRV